MERKALVIGGAGQAGKIHTANVKALDVYVGVFDFLENANCNQNYNAKSSTYLEALKDGYTHVVLALPDNILFREANKLLDALKQLGDESKVLGVLIEKPGSTTSIDLQTLVNSFEEAGLRLFINYQRSFDPKVAQFTREIQRKVQDEGYDLDYISVHSCDKAQPPQAAHQALNQGCHDYALLLHLLNSVNMKVDYDKLTTHGANWISTDDTKFLRMGGLATAPKKETVFDVKMHRVSSKGTYTTMRVDLSKHEATEGNHGMYKPIEMHLQFPEKFDPNSSWADTWSKSFVQSMRSFLAVGTAAEELEPEPVPAKFGVQVLDFAEKALKALN